MQRVLDNFVALEGLDGSGTTTQRALLVSALTAAGRACHSTWEPTDGRLGGEIRRVLRLEIGVHPLTLALLFAADRNEHLHDPQDGILSHLQRGELVLTDRYLFSSLAYQSEQCGFDRVLSLNSAFPLPRHVVFLDTPVEVSQSRVRSRGALELFDAEEVQRRVLGHYQRALSLFPDSGMLVHRVDGARPPEVICRDICEILGIGVPILGA
jgi:dTMP kinase